MRKALALALAMLWLLAALPAGAEEPAEIILGAPTSLNSIEGAESVQAARLAVDQINAAGGVPVAGKRHRLRLEPFDLGEVQPMSPTAQAVERLRGFIKQKKPQAIVVGPFRSEVFLASMDMLAAHRLPTLGSIAMSPAVDAKVLSDSKYKYIFRVGLSTKYLVAYLIESMKLMRRKFGFKKVYILNQDVAWARSTAYLMIKLYFDREGWQVLGQENLSEGVRDFSPALERVREMEGQVILAIFDMPSSRHLVDLWHQLKSPAMLCGFMSPAAGPWAWAESQGRLKGVMNVIFELGNLPSARYPPASAFYQAFQARYGRPIQSGHGPAPAYESVHILAAALTRAGSLDPDRVVEALAATDRQGVMGRVRFHQGHQAIFGQDPSLDALACVVQWTAQGRRMIVHPRLLAEGEITRHRPSP